jgi:transcriptional regulator with XRE-family HTH domain
MTSARGGARVSPGRASGATAFGRFIAERQLSLAVCAAALGITKVHVSTLASGKRRPSLELAWKIDRWTRGAFPMQAWFGGGS